MDLEHTLENGMVNYLSSELRKMAKIAETDRVSSHDYDNIALELIHRYRDGLILDCGAGLRSIYYGHVVNFEIVPYDTTDVLGVGEILPFQDAPFDAVFSLAVLEHVRDPFRCAAEIVRVLKPGGELLCVVPFIQPLHGYPHHYYNMSHQGLRNLFADHLTIESHTVPVSGLPIWSFTWMLRSLAEGLSSYAKQEFLECKGSDLLDQPPGIPVTLL